MADATDRLNARIGRTMPNPLFGALVDLRGEAECAVGASSAATDALRSSWVTCIVRGWHAWWLRRDAAGPTPTLARAQGRGQSAVCDGRSDDAACADALDRDRGGAPAALRAGTAGKAVADVTQISLQDRALSASPAWVGGLRRGLHRLLRTRQPAPSNARETAIDAAPVAPRAITAPESRIRSTPWSQLTNAVRGACAPSPGREGGPPRRPHESAASRAIVSHAPALLLALLLAALWPHLVWIARRLTDGSDEPWGVLAIVTVLLLVWRDRAWLAWPSPRALVASAALAVAAGVAIHLLPMLLAAAIAMLALAVLLTALLPQRPATALTTLLLLSLPVIASLNFYLGYPLRVATAQAAAPLLALLGIDAQPAGAALQFHGRTVLVDAPCAGIGMLWVGSYTAALLSYLNGADARRTLLHAAVAAMLVFGANVLRNVALFFPEAGLIDAPAAAHSVIGLAAFAVALGPVVWLTQWRLAPRAHASAARSCTTPAAAGCKRARATFVGACLVAAAVPLAALALPDRADPAARPVTGEPIEWPTAFGGQPLTQLALTPLEARFAARFPGVIARFAAGSDVLVLRHVTQPTRQLHPAVDCFRAAGYAVDVPRAMVDAEGHAWRCFTATAADGRRLRVCERIASVRGGGAWTDVSAWFWAAWRDGGPWWATTVISPLPAHGV